jgi:hypothetical protein
VAQGNRKPAYVLMAVGEEIPSELPDHLLPQLYPEEQNKYCGLEKPCKHRGNLLKLNCVNILFVRKGFKIPDSPMKRN